MKRLVVFAALALCACGGTTPRPEPEIRTVEVKVQTPVPCPALEQLGPEPAYADTDAALEATASMADKGERTAALAKLYVKGRLQRVQRLKEYVVARASCVF